MVAEASVARRRETGYNRCMTDAALPADDLIRKGLEDLSRGRESVEACLVAIGARRLGRLGYQVPILESPEHRLYLLLARIHGDAAHGVYNALVRRLVSFERAAECAG